MLILCDHRIRTGLSPFRNAKICCHAQIWALERLMTIDGASGDIRWTMVALAMRAFSPLWAFGQHQLGSWIRRLACRLHATDADTMVAAGGG